MFQSTPPRRGRLARVERAKCHECVSIHAPAKGATSSPAPSPSGSRSFNPRPREGGDGGCGRAKRPPRSFNPRPREGGDLSAGLGAED